MEIRFPGHRYALDSLDGQCDQMLQFVTRFRGRDNCAGTNCQDVIRVLIDRVQVLDGELSWSGNQEIIQHLRMALVHFEMRAMMRKVEKGELKPELVPYSPKDGHWIFGKPE